MLILPIKSRLQIVKEREKPESIWTSRDIIMFICPTPEKNLGDKHIFRANNFCRMLPIVTKKIHNRAVVRNKFRRRIKEAFRQINQNLLKNQYDYQILARQSIFTASVESLIIGIESCLRGEAFKGIPERSGPAKKIKKNKKNQTKTSDVLNKKLK